MALGLLTLTAGIMIVILFYAEHLANQSYDRILSASAFTILDKMSNSPEGPVIDIPYSSFQILSQAKNDRITYRITDSTNKTLTGNKRLRPPKGYLPSTTPIFFTRELNGEKFRFIIQAKYLSGSGPPTWITVQLGQTTIARTAFIHKLEASAGTLILLTMIIGLALVWIGINQALKPLVGVEHQLSRRSPMDFSPLKQSQPREIASLVRSINLLIQRHKNSLDRTQNFIADTAHQTRTLLAVLSGTLERAQRHKSPTKTNELIQNSQDHLKRLIHVTNQLLSHAMIIHRAEQFKLGRFVYIDLIREIISEIIPDYTPHNVVFEFEISQHLDNKEEIFCDPITLREAIRNIIDNSIRHSTKHPKIQISVTKNTSDISLRITDNGPGIPSNIKADILERFSLNSQRTGAGSLGMAIIKSTASQHNGSFTIENLPGHGARATLSIPEARKRD
jgi:two-component system sensor histidine kinase TctE